jgi:hypothetical protein
VIKACEQLADEIGRRVTDEYPMNERGHLRDLISRHAFGVLIDWMLGDFKFRD